MAIGRSPSIFFFPLTAIGSGSLMNADRREMSVAIGLLEEISQPSRFAPGRVVRKARRLFGDILLDCAPVRIGETAAG
jgi:hypothetical protein